MTETEQLRKEMNELRERVAVLENQRPKPAPAPPVPAGRPGGVPLFPAGGGILGEAARRQQMEAERHRERFQQWNVPHAVTLGSGVMAQGLSSDGHLGLLGSALTNNLANLYGLQAEKSGVRYGTNPAVNLGTGIEAGPPGCRCGSPHCAPFIPPEGSEQA